MTEDELRAAIENPARQQGVRFEMGLVDRILMDVRGQAGGLPLLEFALTELWACQRHGRLTHVGYEEIGGVAEAIAGYAEEVYRSACSGASRSASGRSSCSWCGPARAPRTPAGSPAGRRSATSAGARSTGWPMRGWS